jgi:hypothetical protein
MPLDEKILERLDYLIDKAEQVRGTHKAPPPGVITNVTLDVGAFVEWQTQSHSFLTNLLGNDHVYVRRFETGVEKAAPSRLNVGQGILRAVREDVEGGYLTDFRTLISAEVFTDFLEMAEHLHDNGYKDPAASLTGAVLEDGLRKIADANGIRLREREDLSSLNGKLVSAGIYNNLMRKKIQVWIDVRNNADHGHFAEYVADDVADMIKGVRSFLADYLK